MKTYYYYRSLRKTIIQFLDLFSNIKIIRYERDGTTVSKYVNVPLKLAGKEKVWYWINQRKDDQMLPMMSVSLQSVEFAAERMGNKLHNITKSTSLSGASMQRFVNPVPYNLNFALSIWSLYMVDIDQILEQILPYFTPEAYIKIAIPEIGGEFDVKVVFMSCTPDVANEMADEENRVVMWNMDFMVHTYVYKPVTEPGVIKDIIVNYFVNEEVWDKKELYVDGTTRTTFTSGASGYAAESMLMRVAPSGGTIYFADDGDPYYAYSIFD